MGQQDKMDPGSMMGQGMPGMGPGMMGQGMPGMMGRGMMGNACPMMGGMRQGGMMGQGCPMMNAMATMHPGGDMPTYVEGRLAFLRAELGITDTQLDLWNAFAAAFRKNVESGKGMRQAMMAAMQAKTPVERLGTHLKTMETRLSALREVKPALEALYANLSAEQKAKADQLLSGMGWMM
jgi:LTXXQ motif family protein